MITSRTGIQRLQRVEMEVTGRLFRAGQALEKIYLSLPVIRCGLTHPWYGKISEKVIGLLDELKQGSAYLATVIPPSEETTAFLHLLSVAQP